MHDSGRPKAKATPPRRTDPPTDFERELAEVLAAAYKQSGEKSLNAFAMSLGENYATVKDMLSRANYPVAIRIRTAERLGYKVKLIKGDDI